MPNLGDMNIVPTPWVGYPDFPFWGKPSIHAVPPRILPVRRQSIALHNPACRLFGHHQGRAVGVAAGDQRHHAGVYHAQAAD